MWHLNILTLYIDPPGPMSGHYFHTWCPSVRPSVRKTNTRYGAKIKTYHNATVYRARWVTLKSFELFIFFIGLAAWLGVPHFKTPRSFAISPMTKRRLNISSTGMVITSHRYWESLQFHRNHESKTELHRESRFSQLGLGISMVDDRL